jgi:toxin YoeB
MRKMWHDEAWGHYVEWQETDRRKLKKVNSLLKSIERSGYQCEGSPEPLRWALSGFWSVKIDKENRLVFRLTGDMIEILSCKGHYE